MSQNSFVFNKRTSGASAPKAVEVLPFLQQANFSGTQYNLLLADNVTLYPAKKAFNLLTLERPVNGTLNRLEALIQSFFYQGSLMVHSLR
jgi:hypothetical protein